MNEFIPLENKLNITFHDKLLLKQAFVHSSYTNEHPEWSLTSNERLEFLGDAFLNLIIARELYQRYPFFDEGKMTSLRAAVVCGETLSRQAKILGLGSFLCLGKGEEESRGRSKEKVLAGVMESLIGAIFLDRGWEEASKVTLTIMEPELSRAAGENSNTDYKSQLQELVQATSKNIPVYKTVDVEGQHHKRIFTVEVLIGEEVLGVGRGSSKKKAETTAAQAALKLINK